MTVRHRPLICLLSVWVVLAGCNSTGLVFDPARTGPLHVPDNYTGVAELPYTLRRVVLLPLAGGEVAPPEMAAEMNAIFATALQRANRFEVVALTRNECLLAFGAEEFRSTAALPHDFINQLRDRYAADAVMFVDLTVLRVRRPLALGVRAKLATTGDDVMLLWNFDEVFSAGEPAVVNSARRHYLLNDDGMVPMDRSDAVLQSPSRYAAYVAQATFATLPPR